MEFMDAEDFKKDVMRMLEEVCPVAFDPDVEDNEVEMEDDAGEEEAENPNEDDGSYQPEKDDLAEDASEAEEEKDDAEANVSKSS